MKNKGFTLVELLAVIVILAIIALIAVPIMLNIINNTKQLAPIRSAENNIEAVELALTNKTLHANNQEVSDKWVIGSETTTTDMFKGCGTSSVTLKTM